MSELAITITGDIRVPAGGSGTFTVEVVNLSSVVDRYTCKVVGVPESWWSVSPAAIELFPDRETVSPGRTPAPPTRGRFTVTISPPRDSTARAGQWPVGALVTSEHNPTVRSVEETTLEVLPFGQLRAELSPSVSRGRTSTSATLRVTNTGNLAETVTARASDPSGALAFELSRPSLEVPAGGDASVRLSIRPPGRIWVGQQLSYPYSVEVRGSTASVAPVGLSGMLVQVPTIPGGLPRFVASVAALGLGAVAVYVLATGPLRGGGGASPGASGASASSPAVSPASPGPSPVSSAPTSNPSPPSPTPATVQVPNVVGELAADARARLEGDDLAVDIREQETTAVQPGIVFDQNPMPGEALEAGDAVTVFVALGPFCDGQRATLLAFADEDVTGTGGDDVIVAVGEGTFTIDAGGGNDRVCLGSSFGAVDGGTGNDRIFGSPEGDVLVGDDGDDLIDGGAGNDWMLGEDRSTETADRGNDELRGGEGNDVLNGDRGDDTLSGGPGADTFLGGPGSDVLDDIDPAVDAMVRAGEDDGEDDYCPGVGNEMGPFMECERW